MTSDGVKVNSTLKKDLSMTAPFSKSNRESLHTWQSQPSEANQPGLNLP